MATVGVKELTSGHDSSGDEQLEEHQWRHEMPLEVGGVTQRPVAEAQSSVTRWRLFHTDQRDSQTIVQVVWACSHEVCRTWQKQSTLLTYILTHSAAIRSILVSRSHLPSVGRRPSVCHSVCVCLSHACYVLQRALCQLFLSAVSQLSCYSGWPHILPATRAAYLVATLRR